MEKALIIGAGGNLGIQLVKVFEYSHDVIGWDRGEIDITDKELVMKKVQDLKPSVIVNAAAYNAVDKMEDDDNEYEIAKKVNIDGPRNLAEAALSVGAIIVHYSSDYVFDGEKEAGYTEDDEVNPVNRYGKTKKLGEKAIIELSSKGLKWFLIRTSKLFGPKGESEVAKDSFFDLIWNMSATRKEFNMVDGEEMSCFTYTPDLAEATKKLIEEDYGYGIYHIINEDRASWYDGAFFLQQVAIERFKDSKIQRFKDLVDVKFNPIKSVDYPRPAKRPKFSALINTKYPKLRSWKEALREYLLKD